MIEGDAYDIEVTNTSNDNVLTFTRKSALDNFVITSVNHQFYRYRTNPDCKVGCEPREEAKFLIADYLMLSNNYMKAFSNLVTSPYTDFKSVPTQSRVYEKYGEDALKLLDIRDRIPEDYKKFLSGVRGYKLNGVD